MQPERTGRRGTLIPPAIGWEPAPLEAVEAVWEGLRTVSPLPELERDDTAALKRVALGLKHESWMQPAWTFAVVFRVLPPGRSVMMPDLNEGWDYWLFPGRRTAQAAMDETAPRGVTGRELWARRPDGTWGPAPRGRRG